MSAIGEKDHVGDIVNDLLNFFRIDFRRLVLAARRLRYELWATLTNCFFLLLMGPVKWLCPVVAVAFARAFRSIASLKCLASLGVNAVADRLRYSLDFFWSNVSPNKW
jgi:hypothetical protein